MKHCRAVHASSTSLQVGIDTVKTLLHHVHPSSPVNTVIPLSSGAHAAVFRIELDNAARPFVLKLYRKDWQMRQEVYVYDIIRHRTDLPCPEIIQCDDSKAVVAHSYILMTMVRGHTVRGLHLRSDDYGTIYRRMGEALRALHEITFRHYGYASSVDIINPVTTNAEYMSCKFMDHLRDFQRLGGDSTLHAQVQEYVAARRHLFDSCTTAVLCHNDLHEGNVLVAQAAGRWEISGIIDVCTAILADPLLDVARTDYASAVGDVTKRAGLLDGYGPMRDDWERAMKIYTLHHALEAWNWFAKHGHPPGALSHIAANIGKVACG
jgi:hygromycin-B 7''-O-kinase